MSKYKSFFYLWFIFECLVIKVYATLPNPLTNLLRYSGWRFLSARLWWAEGPPLHYREDGCHRPEQPACFSGCHLISLGALQSQIILCINGNLQGSNIPDWKEKGSIAFSPAPIPWLVNPFLQ